MADRVSCPVCQQTFRVRDDLAGRKVRCPHCRNGVQPVAAPEQPAADVALPAKAEHTLRVFPAAVVMVWENLNPFLPSLLKKISVIFYLKSLCPVQVDVPPPLSVLVTDTNPTPTEDERKALLEYLVCGRVST